MTAGGGVGLGRPIFSIAWDLSSFGYSGYAEGFSAGAEGVGFGAGDGVGSGAVAGLGLLRSRFGFFHANIFLLPWGSVGGVRLAGGELSA